MRGVAHDLTLKLFSLIVALMLFVFVGVESDTPVDVEFRIEYRLADDIMTTGSPPTVLHTTLQGPWTSFRSFDLEDLKPVVIDLEEAGPGTIRHRIQTRDIKPPTSMKTLSIRPVEVELLLDRKVERQIPVQPDIAGRPAFGFEILDIAVVPLRVWVTGPMTSMLEQNFIYTRTVDVEGREDDLAVTVDLRLPAPPMVLKEKQVEVRVDIGEEMVTRPFGDLPLIIDNVVHGTRVDPRVVTLALRGPRRIVDKLSRDALEPYVDLQPELGEGQTRFEKTVRLRETPERTQLVGAATRVQVEIPRSRRRRK